MKSHQILEIYPAGPLSPQLLDFIDSHDDFEKSLKLSAYPRFIFLPRIITSYPPDYDDEVIGTFYWDRKEKIYKQDFIVNVGFKHECFISYSQLSQHISETERVKGLDIFFKKYGKWNGKRGQFYCRNNHVQAWMHHYNSISELPNDDILKDLARSTAE